MNIDNSGYSSIFLEHGCEFG